jgi:hypothetical protein
VLAQKAQLFRFRLRLVLFGYRDDDKRNFVEISKTLAFRMVADDERDVSRQFAALLAIQQVVQAVIVSGDEDGNTLPPGDVGDTPLHLKTLRNRRKSLRKVLQFQIEAFEMPFHTHEKALEFVVGVLVCVQNVAVVAEDEITDGGDEAFLVGAGDQENGVVFHACARTPAR